MNPRLSGRVQTRALVTGLIGSLWALPATLFIPRPIWGGHRIALQPMYRMTLTGVALMTMVGLAWELVYHALQQLRRDKAWPSLFALVASIPEGATTWFGLHALDAVPGPVALSSPFFGTFAVFFLSAWILVWLFLQGPVRVIAIRWRYNGARFF